MDKYNELEQFVLAIKKDLEKFHNRGNKTAGLRVRKTLQDIKAISQEIRVEISAKRKAMPKKTKV